MSLRGLEPGELNPKSEVLANLQARVRAVSAEDPATVDEQKFIDLIDAVSDALHIGDITLEQHDELITETRESWAKVV